MATHPLAIRCPYGQAHEAQDPAGPVEPDSLAVRRCLSISMDKCRMCRSEVVAYIAGCAAEFTDGGMVTELFDACVRHTVVVDTLARRPLDGERMSLQDLVRMPSWMMWPRTVEFMRRGWVEVRLPHARVDLGRALAFARGLCVADRREIVDDALDRAAGIYSLSVEQLHAFRGA
ncbi:hypothetical protein J4H86_05860 [Spiractinospora alimapuensis]|uniref:hypothetical protein n=1 Tax=Spiractinospora alimapuensis TaxID=2820884 RepID=UPI001F3182A1|nr:hypothetical protein [Spiractinospora alimapuensis]QVQ53294.1 hypothetical protein J4H86_05860 [Spiractinospora alimapuensis]